MPPPAVLFDDFYAASPPLHLVRRFPAARRSASLFPGQQRRRSPEQTESATFLQQVAASVGQHLEGKSRPRRALASPTPTDSTLTRPTSTHRHLHPPSCTTAIFAMAVLRQSHGSGCSLSLLPTYRPPGGGRRGTHGHGRAIPRRGHHPSPK